MAVRQYDQAERVARTIARWAACEFGPESKSAMDTSWRHANVLEILGRLDESRVILRKILPVQTRLLGLHHTATRQTEDLLAQIAVRASSL